MNILITGARGFLSSALIRNTDINYNLTLVSRSPFTFDKNIDVLDYERLYRLNRKFSTVFHLASKISDIDSKNNFEENVVLAKNLTTKLDFNQVVFSSSVSVFDTIKNSSFNEDSACLPITEYGESKLEVEKIISKLSKYKIVRFSSLYGPGMSEATFIPIIVKQALEKNEIKLFGKGERRQNYLHVKDAISCLISAEKYRENGIFLGVFKMEYSNLEVAEIVSKYTNAKIFLQGSDNSKSVRYDNSKTRNLLNWNPEIDLETGIKKYIEWKQKQY